MGAIALGTVVFKRTGRIEQLLASIGPPIETVYVADNGQITDERAAVYDRDYPFDLEVLDLAYDSGLGHGRNEIVSQTTEEYLAIVDCDMTMPANIDYLAAQLDARPDLGGVSGLLFEDGGVVGACCDLYEADGLLFKDIRGGKESASVGGHPFVEFDFVPNAAMFRMACLDSYSWDPEYRFGSEHLDFYVAHKKRTDWTFGTCPAVVFPHFPGGNQEYMDARKGERDQKARHSRQYFLDKWGYRRAVPLQSRWVESFSDPRFHRLRFLLSHGGRMLLRNLPAAALEPVLDLHGHLQSR